MRKACLIHLQRLLGLLFFFQVKTVQILQQSRRDHKNPNTKFEVLANRYSHLDESPNPTTSPRENEKQYNNNNNVISPVVAPVLQAAPKDNAIAPAVPLTQSVDPQQLSQLQYERAKMVEAALHGVIQHEYPLTSKIVRIFTSSTFTGKDIMGHIW